MGFGLLTLMSRLPFVGRFLGNKWSWIIMLIIGFIWFITYTIEEYSDSIRETVITQIRADEYRNQVEALSAEIESLVQLQDEQMKQLSDLTQRRRRDELDYQRRLRELQSSGLTGLTYLGEAANLASRPDSPSYEEYQNGIQNEETPDDQ